MSVKIEVLDYDFTDGLKFYSAYESTNTFIVKISPGNAFEMFRHSAQTDQLITVKGTSHLLWIEEDRLKCYTMHESSPAVVTVPPGVIHGSINTGDSTCTIVNALIKKGEPAPDEYTPILLEDLSMSLQDQYQQLMRIIDA